MKEKSKFGNKRMERNTSGPSRFTTLQVCGSGAFQLRLYYIYYLYNTAKVDYLLCGSLEDEEKAKI